jgi:hypothetical protein
LQKQALDLQIRCKSKRPMIDAIPPALAPRAPRRSSGNIHLSNSVPGWVAASVAPTPRNTDQICVHLLSSGLNVKPVFPTWLSVADELIA